MKRILHILLCMLLLTACYKDDVVPEELDHNPFDRDYAGPPVFALAGTYVENVTIQGQNILQQVVEFTVDEGRFLEPASYFVQVTDQELQLVTVLAPVPPGSNIFKYYRPDDIAWGEQVCIELRLMNNFSTARPETICATL